MMASSRWVPSGGKVAYLLAAICAVAFLAASWITADVPPLRPDTASYLYFDPSRPVGYPLVLWLADRLGAVTLAVPLQMLALTASLFLLGLAFYRWTGRPVLAALFQLGLLLSPEMWKFAAMLITEAMATAGVGLWCAQLLRTVRAPGFGGFAVLTLLSGIAVLVKPALLPLFFGTAVLTLALPAWRERWRALALIAAGLVATLGITPLANLLVHGSPESGSPVARGVLQHTLFCPLPNVPADPDSAFVDRHARAISDYVDAAPAAVRPGLKRIYTGKLRFGLIIPTLGRRHGLDESWQTDALVWRIAKERLVANPGCYAASVLRSYYAMATYKSSSARDSKRLRDHLTAQPPADLPVVPLLPGDDQLAKRAAVAVGADAPQLPGRQDFDPPTGRPAPLVWAARLLYGSAAALGLLALLLLFVRQRLSFELSELTLAVAALGIVFHGVVGLTAIVELALMRYTVPVWPVVCTLLGLVGAYLLSRAEPLLARARHRRLS